MIPFFPLVLRIDSRKRRRVTLLVMVIFAFLLMAQSCEAYGSLSGTYSFPLPVEGFVCEVSGDNPNLAEMPGSTGQAGMEITTVDDEGNSETCSFSANVSGLGILKRDGFYTEEMFDE